MYEYHMAIIKKIINKRSIIETWGLEKKKERENYEFILCFAEEEQDTIGC